jgi:hypothetical protein
MNARLTKDERRAIAQRIFAALCAYYPDRHIALFERPQADISSAERVVANTSVAPPARVYDGADKV